MLTKAIDKITSVFTIISYVVFGIIVVIVMANIIGRTAFQSPINGTMEIVQYGMLFCIGMVMCRTGFEDRHIIVSVLIDIYPARIRALFIAFAKLLGTAVFATLTFLYVLEIPQAMASGKVTDAFRIPFEYVYVLMILCFAAGALIFFYQFCLAMYMLITGKGAPEKTSNLTPAKVR
jgi:TRAP-type C4-dicarboxylate transport system permease small subunit